MRRRLPRGLRPRLLLALLLTSAVTLGVAATVLLSPLPDRLREQSAHEPARRPCWPPRRRLRGRRCATQPEGPVRRPARRPRSCASAPTAACSCSTPVAAGRRAVYDTSTGASVRGAALTLVALHTPARPARRPRPTSRATSCAIGVRLFGDKGGVAGVLVVERRLTEVTTAVDQVRNALLAAGAVGLLVAVALAVALSSTLLRRLGRLRTAAVRISQEGVADAPLQHDAGRDEVGDLARAFGRMQEELRRQEAARRSFVATASHELRTPLTMLQGTMELLEEDLARRPAGHRRRPDPGRARPPRAAAALEPRRRAARPQPARRVGAAALGAGRARRAGARGRRRVRACAPTTATSSSTSSRRRGPCWSRGDPDAVARVVRILLDNALRYGPAGRADPRDAPAATPHRAHVEVADRGPGRAPGRARADLRALPARAQRQRGGRLRPRPGDRPRARRADGRLARAGRRGRAAGTRFRLELPAAEPEPGARAGAGRPRYGSFSRTVARRWLTPGSVLERAHRQRR